MIFVFPVAAAAVDDDEDPLEGGLVSYSLCFHALEKPPLKRNGNGKSWSRTTLFHLLDVIRERRDAAGTYPVALTSGLEI